MTIPPGRYDKRTTAAVAVMLTSPESAFTTELALTENISERGARVLDDNLEKVLGALSYYPDKVADERYEVFLIGVIFWQKDKEIRCLGRKAMKELIQKVRQPR